VNIKLPIVVVVPLTLFLMLLIVGGAVRQLAIKEDFQVRLQQTVEETDRLLWVLQELAEERFAKGEFNALDDVFNAIVSHNYLQELNIITSTGVILFSDRLARRNTEIDSQTLSQFTAIQTKHIEINEQSRSFTLVYPIRKLSGNFSEHVGYIQARFDLQPIYEQVSMASTTRLLDEMIFVFILMLALFGLLIVTVKRPLSELQHVFQAMATRDYDTSFNPSVWVEFAELAKQADLTRMALIEAEREEVFLAKIFNIAEGLLILDSELCVLRCNKGLEAILGKSEEQVVGKSSIELGLFIESHLQVLSVNKQFFGYIELEREPGIRHLLVSASEVRSHGETFYVGLVKDNTEQVKNAKEREDARARFIASVSHELRTPLNGIMGLSKLLENEELSENQQSYLANIKGSSELLLRVINEILDFSKIEAGQLQIENVAIHFEDTFSDVISVFRLMAENKGLKFNVYFDPDIPKCVMGDPVRLQQILNNYCSNALKFTPSGSINVAFKLVERNEQTARVRCIVTDTGIGISLGRQQELFEAFTQEDQSITRKYGGTGLGLFITDQLITAMGGDTIFYSQKNQSSTFGFELNLDITDVCATSSVESDHFLSVQDWQVLVVDDNVINLEVAKELLVDYCNHVEVADSGAKAFELSRGKQWDLVLMDIQMPEMDGIQAMKKMRKDTHCSVQRFFALTANVMASDVRHYMEEGFDGVVSKPFDVEALLRQLTDLDLQEH